MIQKPKNQKVMKYNTISLALVIGLVIITSSAVFAEQYNVDFVINEQKTKSPNSVEPVDSLSNAWRVGLQSNLLGGWLKGSGELTLR